LVDSHKVVTRNLNRFNFDLNPIFKFVRVWLSFLLADG
jgi:hypothetical protein